MSAQIVDEAPAAALLVREALEAAGAAGAAGGAVFDAASRAKAKHCLLDFLACAIEARDLEWSLQARRVAGSAATGAAIVGSGYARSAGDAAFANGVAGHGLVREDMHAGAIAHLGVVVWPALLAEVSRTRVDGGRFLAAAIVGYEVGARLGRALMSVELARLFRPTGLVGAPAASVALAVASRLDESAALNAFSLAANTVAGLNQWPHSGGSEMYFHPGFAARNAVTAFELAEAGAVASPMILEGEAGLFAAYGRTSLDCPITLFEDGAEILNVFNKEVPACNFAQTPCQAALLAIADAPAGARVVRVEIFVTRAAERYPGCNARGPFERALQAKMSIPFGVAATIARGEIAEANYARLDDAQIARLIAASELVVDPQLTAAFPGRQGARVKLTFEDGTSAERALPDVVPASDELIVARFLGAATRLWGRERAEAIRDVVLALDEGAGPDRLNALLAADSGRPAFRGEGDAEC